MTDGMEFIGNTANDIEDLRALAWLPGEFAAAGMEDIKRAQELGTKWMAINVPKLGSYFAPTRAGQLVSVIGKPSMGKSLLLHHFNHQMAAQLVKEKRFSEAIYHVSVEEPIEYMAMLALAKQSGERVSDLSQGIVQDAGMLSVAANNLSGIPIIYIAESVTSKRPQTMVDSLNLTNVFRTIQDVIQQTQMAPAAITIDYLQALPIDPRLAKSAEPVDHRRLQVRADVYFTRRAGLFFGCPMFLGVQAKQTLAGESASRRDQQMPMIVMPGMFDGEESSSIGQRSDRIMSVCIPARLYPIGTTAQLGTVAGEVMEVDEDDFLVKVVKQRGFLPAGKTFQFKIDYATGEMNPPSGV